MHKKRTLSSIPELDIEEDLGRKWVSKKKHEVLKAKYKCLKKLFQIYDATVVDILPEQNDVPQYEEEPETNHRRKRSHRTKTDACAGTTEFTSSGDLSINSEHTSIDTGTQQLDNTSCISTQIDLKHDKYAETIASEENVYSPLNLSTPMPNLMFERRKLTRFQAFVQRLFGLRECGPKDYSASDSLVQKRSKGLRFRRLRRAKKIKSEGSLRELKSPILSYVQSVQRNCLMDMTPRQCPMPGCQMILYGIINYNDHLNLCHLKDRKFICHYCHEGFQTEQDKICHENEHLGITKLSNNMINIQKINTNTQADMDDKISDEKLKKIVSFFDKISDPEQMLNNIKKRASECVLKDCSSDGGKTRTISCCNVRTDNNNNKKSVSSASVGSSTVRNYGSVACHFCGETFNHRRQLSLHVNLEHRAHDKFSKYHSCAGILHRSKSRTAMSLTDGRISVQSEKDNKIPRRKSSASLTCESISNPSKVYFTSAETVNPIETSYDWEPASHVKVFS